MNMLFCGRGQGLGAGEGRGAYSGTRPSLHPKNLYRVISSCVWGLKYGDGPHSNSRFPGEEPGAQKRGNTVPLLSQGGKGVRPSGKCSS